MGDTELQKRIDALRKKLLELKDDLIKSLEAAIKTAEGVVDADKTLIDKKMMAANSGELAKDQATVASLRKQLLDANEDLLKELLDQQAREEKDKKK